MEKTPNVSNYIKRIPIKIVGQKTSSSLTRNNGPMNIKNNNFRNSNSLKKSFYSYPIALYIKPDIYEEYKEKLLLSKKQKTKKPLINKNYHHINFKSHSKSMLFNLDNKSTDNKKIDDLFKTQTHYKDKTRNKNNNKDKEMKSLYKTFYNRDKEEQNNNNIFQQKYLSEVEKRGFNYNKIIQLNSLQRSALNNFSKNYYSDYVYDNNIYYMNNSPISYVLEVKTRKYFPQMKAFLVNKFRNIKKLKSDLKERKYINHERSQNVINIKNDPNFKFHIFHDRKGKVKELDKPCERVLKMTKSKVRDLKIMQKINKINDPEIIEMYKSFL